MDKEFLTMDKNVVPYALIRICGQELHSKFKIYCE